MSNLFPSGLPTNVVQPPKNPLDDFDPNNRGKSAPPWASYCPSRNPKFKTHRQRGHAMSSIKYNAYRGGILYIFEDGKWVERARFQPHGFRPTHCDGCGQNLLVDEERYNFQKRLTEKTGRKIVAGEQVFARDARGRIESPERVLMLCRGCKRGLGHSY